MVLALSVLLLLREGAAGLQAYTGVERLQDVDEFTQLSRFALWGAAFLMFRSNMLIGTGYGTFRYLYNDYIPGIPGGQLDSHNFYLQTLAETGLIGFFAFFLMLYGFFRRGYALIREDDPVYRIVGIGVCGAIVGFLIHGFVDFLFIVSPQFGAMFWLVMALGLSAFENCTSGQMPAATTV
jgi:O-antigen ligase